jgi:hypothetical protein
MEAAADAGLTCRTTLFRYIPVKKLAVTLTGREAVGRYRTSMTT